MMDQLTKTVNNGNSDDRVSLINLLQNHTHDCASGFVRDYFLIQRSRLTTSFLPLIILEVICSKGSSHEHFLIRLLALFYNEILRELSQLSLNLLKEVRYEEII